MLTVQRLQRKMLQLLNSPNSLLAVLWISLFYFSFPLDPSTYLSDHFFSPTRTCPGFCPFTSRLQNAPFRAQQHHSLISSQRCDWAAWGPLSWLEKSPVQSRQHNPNIPVLEKAAQVSEVHLLHISLLLPLHVGQASEWPKHWPGKFISTEDSI